jgi:hypothetical protein
MARPKLTGSLLGCDDPPPETTPAQHISAPSTASPFETLDWPLRGSDCTDASVSVQVVPAVGGTGSPSPVKQKNRRFGPIVRFDLAIGGVAATTAVGIALFMLCAGHSAATITLQSIPASPSVSNPMPAPQALEPTAEPPAGVLEASNLAVSTRVGTPGQPTATGATAAPAADPEPAPTSAAVPVAPQPEPAPADDPPAPAAPSAGARLPAEDVAALVARGDEFFGNGDVVSARLFYEHAAEGGDAQAVLRLGMTYDPAFLARVRMNGVYSDAAAAAQWYRHALTLGAVEAQILLSAVAANDEAAKGSGK